MLCVQDRAVNYKEAIKRMLKAGEYRLIVNLDDVRSYDREFCDGLASYISYRLPGQPTDGRAKMIDF